MTLQEIDGLIEDTKKLPRAADKVALSTALGTLEVARQLAILNEHLAKLQLDIGKAAKAGK
ncbi:MAG TPA: hypothetical protein VFU76_00925 [Terriglobales bacterium]|nr:hypothetical protein [Terriglobales bacterium]